MLRSGALFAAMMLMFSARAENTSFVYINGGVRDSENTWFHEQDILAFKNSLFNPRSTTILTAGGVNSQYADNDGNGNFKRRPDGYVVLKPTQAGGDILPANMETVRATYEKLRTEAPSRAVVVYGDHGSWDGLSLYNGSILANSQHFALQNSLSEKTLLRSIHIQCFAGSMLVDQTRKMPETDAGLPAFLDKYYQKNKCGLALSRHNEMGQYYNQSENWQTSPWTNYFTKAKPPTLADLQKHLNADGRVAPTPVLTSDYLAEDLTRYLCNQMRERVKNCEKPGPLNQVALAELCATETEELDRKNLFVEKSFEHYMSASVVASFWTSKYLKDRHPEWEPTIFAMEKKNYMTFVLDTEQDPARKVSLAKELEEAEAQIDKKALAGYLQESASLIESPTPEFKAYMKKNCSIVPGQGGPVPKDVLPPGAPLTPMGSGACLEEAELATKARVNGQMELKAMNAHASSRRAMVLSKLFADPMMSKVKDRYENIKKCESSSLR